MSDDSELWANKVNEKIEVLKFYLFLFYIKMLKTTSPLPLKASNIIIRDIVGMIHENDSMYLHIIEVADRFEKPQTLPIRYQDCPLMSRMCSSVE